MSKKMFNDNCEKRIKLAKEVASKCPIKYGKEIVIVGSVSRNLADEDSDVEIEFLTDEKVEEETIINWIKELGGTDLYPYGMPLWDGSTWIIFKYNGYWIEAGWQKIENMKTNLELILDEKVNSHEKLLLASTFKNAIFIRDNNNLKFLQEKLENYPIKLAKDIILETIKPWTVGLAIESRKMLAKRDDKIPFLQRMIPDIQRILRVLYAVNKQWEPDWKWTKHIVEDLKIKPENLEKRIDSIICINESKTSLENCFNLIKDTLNLIPKEYELDDVTDEILKLIYRV